MQRKHTQQQQQHNKARLGPWHLPWHPREYWRPRQPWARPGRRARTAHTKLSGGLQRTEDKQSNYENQPGVRIVRPHQKLEIYTTTDREATVMRVEKRFNDQTSLDLHASVTATSMFISLWLPVRKHQQTFIVIFCLSCQVLTQLQTMTERKQATLPADV